MWLTDCNEKQEKIIWVQYQFLQWLKMNELVYKVLSLIYKVVVVVDIQPTYLHNFIPSPHL